MKITNNKENILWNIIKESKWGSDHDYERIQNIWRGLPKDIFKELEEFVEEKYSILYKKYKDNWLHSPGIELGDDSWSDLLYEIVGRGKEFYYSISLDKIQQMVNENDFEECFAYCL